MMKLFQKTGAVILESLENIGKVVLFSLDVVVAIFRPPFYFKKFISQTLDIGFYSLPVIGMTTLFAGMVMALQSYSGLSGAIAEFTVPNIVMLAITRELAPVLTGLMVAGRIGASIAAEIGTMKVTEQIDALKTLSTDPIKYLVVPRVLAGVLTMPLLVLVGDSIGILGGYLISVYKLGLNSSTYMTSSIDAISQMGVLSGLVKASCFGLIITLIGCYQGYRSSGGAMGVGRATTNAVVWSSILILISNYVITEIFVGL